MEFAKKKKGRKEKLTKRNKTKKLFLNIVKTKGCYTTERKSFCLFFFAQKRQKGSKL
jgi:hypothetical protein